MRGVDPKLVQTAGRWVSESSFRTYIDTAGSLHVRTQIEFNRLLTASHWCKEHISDYFVGLACINGQGKPCRLSRAHEQARPAQTREQVPGATTARVSFAIPEAQMAGGATRGLIQPASARQSADSANMAGPPTAAAAAKAVVRPKARAEASFFRLAGQANPFSIRCCRRWTKPVLSSGGVLFGLLMLAVCSGSQGPLFHVARVFGAIADVSEASSAVTIHALNFTNQVAQSAGSWVAVATTNGLTAGANLWKGVDLGEISATRCGGSIVVTSPAVLRHWLDSPMAISHFPCLTEVLKQRLFVAVASITQELPYTQALSDELNMTGSFMSLRVGAQRLDESCVLAWFEATSLVFGRRWANPLWDQLGCPLSTERDQVLRALRLLLLDLPPSPQAPVVAMADLEMLPVALQTLETPPAAWQMILMQMYSLFDDSLRGGGFIETGGAFLGAALDGSSFTWVTLYLGLGFMVWVTSDWIHRFCGNRRARLMPMILDSAANEQEVGVAHPEVVALTPRSVTTICSRPLSESSFQVVDDSLCEVDEDIRFAEGGR